MSAPSTVHRGPVGVSPRVDCVFKALMGDPVRNAVYRARLDWQRIQATREEAMAQALADKMEALAELERLREAMRSAGLDPDKR